MASIKKRCDHQNPAKCRCSWSVRWRDTDGRLRERSFPFDKKTVANDFARKAEGDKVQGVRTVTSNAAFGPYATKVIRQRTGAASTQQRYLGILSNHLGVLAGRKLAVVANDRAGIKTLLLETLPAKGLGRAQVELAQVVIVSTVMEAVREREIPSHALSGIRLPAEDQSASFVIPTHEQVGKLAGGLPGNLALAVWLARGCGLRLGEVLAVKTGDFTNHMSVLTITEQVRSGTATSPLKSRKPGESRSVPVPAYVAGRVREHMKTQGVSDGYLFRGKTARFVSDTSFGTVWRVSRDAAGLAGFRFHDLRHCWASYLLAQGVPVTDVARWAGHRSIEVTYRTYSHFIPKSFDKARDVLDAEWAS